MWEVTQRIWKGEIEEWCRLSELKNDGTKLEEIKKILFCGGVSVNAKYPFPKGGKKLADFPHESFPVVLTGLI